MAERMMTAEERANGERYFGSLIRLLYTIPIEEFRQGTLDCLKDLYGVDNLSVIEMFHLRRIIEECRGFLKGQLESLTRGEINQMSVIDVEPEAAARWLIYLYSITPRMARDITVLKKECKELQRAYAGEADRLHEIAEDIQGNTYTTVSPEMKEYIRLLRERAHFP
jgi:hypothetical protein